MRTEKELKICKECKYAVGDTRRMNEVGCGKTFDWTLIPYLNKCPLDKWNK